MDIGGMWNVRVPLPVSKLADTLVMLMDCRLDLWTSDLILQRMKTAIQSLHQDPVSQYQGDTQAKGSESTRPAIMAASGQSYAAPPEETILVGTALRDVILGGFSEGRKEAGTHKFPD